MAETLFSGKDADWLNGLMGQLGDGQVHPHDDASLQVEPQATQPNIPQEDYSDLENLSKEDIEVISVAGLYMEASYVARFSETPKNLDVAAIQMMRSFGTFLKYAQFNDGKSKVSIGEKYRGIGLRHVRLGSRFVLRAIDRDLSKPLLMDERREELNMAKTHYVAVSAIATRAIEMEDLRRQREMRQM